MATRSRLGLRTDVEGLRAVAILAVVLYHAHVGGFGGGYVGVDVFFVVSGFLITSLLWRELTERGKVSFGDFYGRRVRRLLPASMLVVVVTVIASARWLPPLGVHRVIGDAVASSLYVPNYRFALQSTNYLAATTAPSPLQHYWSLGVEEQFYLLWPALLLVVSLAWRRSRQVSWHAATSALVVAGVASFALSLWLTRVSQPWAFFSLPTRAWELMAGGLIALTAPQLRRLPRPASVILGWAGIAAILWSVTRLSGSTPFPGRAALIPVGGTAAVLMAGTPGHPWGPVVVLRRLVFQVLGKLSYSWYLWHWPVLVVTPAIVGHSLNTSENVGLAVLSLGLAFLTVVVVELPIRFSPWLAHQARRSLTLGAALTAGAVALSLFVASSLALPRGHGVAPAAAATGVAEKPAATTPANTAKSAAIAGPPAVELAAQTAPVVNAVANSVNDEDVPTNLQPSLAHAHRDDPPVYVDGCMDSFTDATVRSCVFGDPNSPTSVFLFGDSHASMWFPAFDQLAKTRNWRLVAVDKATCPPLQLELRSPDLGRQFTECDQWRANVLARIRAERPALVVLGVARHYNSLYHFTVYSPQWLQGLATMISSIRQLGSQVALMGPIPKPPIDVPNCLSAHTTSAVACTVPLAVAINADGRAAEQATTVAAGGSYVNPQPWFCTSTTCAAMVDNLLVWRDDNHITATYATWLTAVVGAQVDVATHGTL
ncbi:MAG TPA: acyltransferase family protein [Acidimicrobiales bacterium]|nr:acyltransferase family protein [Acidimicrobiales bacterium]